MGKIVYHQGHAIIEANILKEPNDKAVIIHINEKQFGCQPKNLVIHKNKGERKVSINGIELECEMYQLIKDLFKDE